MIPSAPCTPLDMEVCCPQDYERLYGVVDLVAATLEECHDDPCSFERLVYFGEPNVGFARDAVSGWLVRSFTRPDPRSPRIPTQPVAVYGIKITETGWPDVDPSDRASADQVNAATKHVMSDVRKTLETLRASASSALGGPCNLIRVSEWQFANRGGGTIAWRVLLEGYLP